MSSFRAPGPKSGPYKQLEKLIESYYEQLRKNKKNDRLTERFLANIRNFVLTKGCSDEDITSDNESQNNNNNPLHNLNGVSSNQMNPSTKLLHFGRALPTMRKVEDTLRGRLWRVLIGTGFLDHADYQKQIHKKEYMPTYIKLRGDSKRTFASIQEYMSRVSEERLVRIINSYCHKYNCPYVQGMNVIAGGLLYVMPELDAYHTFCLLGNKHCPTYWISDNNPKHYIIGAYAGSWLAHDILRLCDFELYQHLKHLHPHMFLFPNCYGFSAFAKPFLQLLKLWDFLFCFGIHLIPIIVVSQLIINRSLLLNKSWKICGQTLLSMNKWMNGNLNAKKTIQCSMDIIIKLKSNENSKKIWQQILTHGSQLNIAQDVVVTHHSSYTFGNMANMGNNNTNNNNILSHNNNNIKVNINNIHKNSFDNDSKEDDKDDDDDDDDDDWGIVGKLATNNWNVDDKNKKKSNNNKPKRNGSKSPH